MKLEDMTRDELARELEALLRRTDEKDKELERDLSVLRVHQVELEMQNRELREAHAALEESRTRYQELYDFAPIAYFTLDEKGVIREVNLTGATMVGRERDALVGQAFALLVKVEEPSRFWGQLKRCATTRGPVVSEMRITTDRGHSHDLQVVMTPVFGSGGRAVAFRTSFVDVSERKRAETELALAHANEGRLHRHFEALDGASARLTEAQRAHQEGGNGNVLQAVVDQARALVDAEFAAFAVTRHPDEPFETFVSSSLVSVPVIAVDHVPFGPQSLLGAVARSRRAMRLSAVREHPLFMPFPPEHPSMQTFLGIGIPFGGMHGVLYAANKRLGAEFGEDDERRLEVFAERAGLVLEVTRLTDEVRDAVRARDNVLAAVAHDLRSPLNTLSMSTKLLTRTGVEVERRQNRRQIDIILRACERMNRLIGDLLQGATLDAGRFSIETSREAVGPIVLDTIEALEPLASGKNIHLCAKVAPDIPPIRADRQRLMQVLENLIGNAIKFVPEGGRIDVCARAEGDEAWITVVDDGPGIRSEELPHLFDRYWKSRPASHRGVGLGLHIAKGIVQAHGGRIWVESREGDGTTFGFTIPFAAREQAHAIER